MEVQYILVYVFLVGYVTFCYGQEAAVVLPSRCAAVSCVQPSCPNPVILKAECCPVCFDDCTLVDCGITPIECVAPPGGCCPVCNPRTCNINGEIVNSGASVKVDCNTCICSDAFVFCTKNVCEKPGSCPQLRNSIGHCASLCSSDQDCQGHSKCCSNGCGHVCMNPIKKATQPDCPYVTCPSLPRHCRRMGYIPPGQCCPICPGSQDYWRRRHHYDD